MKRSGPCFVALLVVLLVAACGDGQGPTASPGGAPSDELHGRTFLSTSVTDGGQPRELVPGTRVSVSFARDGKIDTNAGCNTIYVPVDLGDGKLLVNGGVMMTAKGCAAKYSTQDEWLADFFRSGPSWRLDGDELVLTSPATEIVLLDRTVAEPDKPIEGTRWQLETIFTGETASSIPAGVDAHLTFAEGRVTGSTGCNTLEGPATVSGDLITFGPLTMTRKACPDDQGSVERAMVAVLQGEVPFSIISDELTLDPGADQALGLRG